MHVKIILTLFWAFSNLKQLPRTNNKEDMKLQTLGLILPNGRLYDIINTMLYFFEVIIVIIIAIIIVYMTWILIEKGPPGDLIKKMGFKRSLIEKGLPYEL